MMDSKKNTADGDFFLFFFFYSSSFLVSSFLPITISEVVKLRAGEMNSVKFNHGN